MRKVYKNKRGGADTIIAALLLIGIAIAGSFMVYRTLFTSASNITNKSLIFISDASLTTFQGNKAALLQLTIQNQGTYDANLTKITIYSQASTPVNVTTINKVSILSGEQKSISQIVSGTFYSGQKYLIVLQFTHVNNQNTTVSVNVVAQ
ncbi:MAG: hypothetical protein ACP5OK_00670 [Thermoprotei archaeon]